MKKLFLFFQYLFMLFTLLTVMTTPAFAACPAGQYDSGKGCVTGGITNPIIAPSLGSDPTAAANGTTFQTYFLIIWRGLITLGFLAVLLNFVTGAMHWVTAGGEQNKVAQARQQMTNSVIGMVILAGSFVLISFIASLFGINILKFTLPTPQ